MGVHTLGRGCLTYLSPCTWPVSRGTPVEPPAPSTPPPELAGRGILLPSTKDCTSPPPLPRARDSPPVPRVPRALRACRGRFVGSGSRNTGVSPTRRETAGVGEGDPTLEGPGCRTTDAASSRQSGRLLHTLGGCTRRVLPGLY